MDGCEKRGHPHSTPQHRSNRATPSAVLASARAARATILRPGAGYFVFCSFLRAMISTDAGYLNVSAGIMTSAALCATPPT